MQRLRLGRRAHVRLRRRLQVLQAIRPAPRLQGWRFSHGDVSTRRGEHSAPTGVGCKRRNLELLLDEVDLFGGGCARDHRADVVLLFVREGAHHRIEVQRTRPAGSS